MAGEEGGGGGGTSVTDDERLGDHQSLTCHLRGKTFRKQDTAWNLGENYWARQKVQLTSFLSLLQVSSAFPRVTGGEEGCWCKISRSSLSFQWKAIETTSPQGRETSKGNRTFPHYSEPSCLFEGGGCEVINVLNNSSNLYYLVCDHTSVEFIDTASALDVAGSDNGLVWVCSLVRSSSND